MRREIGWLCTEVGDEWRCFIEGGQVWVAGSDIEWQRRPALEHGLVLDGNETKWLEACIGIAAALLRGTGGQV